MNMKNAAPGRKEAQRKPVPTGPRDVPTRSGLAGGERVMEVSRRVRGLGRCDRGPVAVRGQCEWAAMKASGPISITPARIRSNRTGIEESSGWTTNPPSPQPSPIRWERVPRGRVRVLCPVCPGQHLKRDDESEATAWRLGGARRALVRGILPVNRAPSPRPSPRTPKAEWRRQKAKSPLLLVLVLVIVIVIPSLPGSGVQCAKSCLGGFSPPLGGGEGGMEWENTTWDGSWSRCASNS